jgi:hypothetical protein
VTKIDTVDELSVLRFYVAPYLALGCVRRKTHDANDGETRC